MLVSWMAVPLLAAEGVMTYRPEKLPRPMTWLVPGCPPAALPVVLYSESQSK